MDGVCYVRKRPENNTNWNGSCSWRVQAKNEREKTNVLAYSEQRESIISLKSNKIKRVGQSNIWWT